MPLTKTKHATRVKNTGKIALDRSSEMPIIDLCARQRARKEPSN